MILLKGREVAMPFGGGKGEGKGRRMAVAKLVIAE